MQDSTLGKKLRPINKISYAAGDLAANLSMTTISTYLMFFCTEVFGMAAATVSTLFFIVRMWDAVDDPITGIIIDKTNTRWGTYRPYLLFGPPFLAITTYLLFTTPDFSPTGKSIWILLMYGLNSLLFSIVNIPYNALATTMTKDPDDRTSLVMYRTVATSISYVIINFLMTKSMGMFDQPVDGYRFTTAIFGVGSVILYLMTFFGCRETYSYKSEESRYKIKEVLPLVWANKPYLILLGAYVITTASMGMFYAVLAYFMQYIVGDMNVLGMLFMITLLPTLLALIVAPKIIQKIDKKKAYYLFGGLAALGYLMPFLLPKTAIVIYIAGIIRAFGMPVLIIFFSVLPDTADYGTYCTGKDCTGILSANFTFFNKFAFALGGMIAGWILSAFNYAPGGVEQTTEALLGINMLFTVIPAIMIVLGVFVFSRYKLTADDIRDMNREMIARSGKINI